MTEEAKIKASEVESTTKLKFEYTQVLQTLNLQAKEAAAVIEADTAAKAMLAPHFKNFTYPSCVDEINCFCVSLVV